MLLIFLVCLVWGVLVLSYYVSLSSEFRVVISVMTFSKKRFSVLLYLQLFVGGLYLRYLCLLAHTHCVVSRLVYIRLAVSLVCPFLIALRYSLTCIYSFSRYCIALLQNYSIFATLCIIRFIKNSRLCDDL